MIPLLDQSHESNLYASFEKQNKAKVKFQDGEDDFMNDEFILKALQ